MGSLTNTATAVVEEYGQKVFVGTQATGAVSASFQFNNVSDALSIPVVPTSASSTVVPNMPMLTLQADQDFWYTVTAGSIAVAANAGTFVPAKTLERVRPLPGMTHVNVIEATQAGTVVIQVMRSL